MRDRRRRPGRRWRGRALETGLLVLALALGLAPQAQAGFAYRKLVTVAGSQVVGGPHTNFPVLFGVLDAQLRLAPTGGVQSPQGCDVSFRASDGVTPLDYQILSYLGASGVLAAVVKLPSIQNGVNTQFYIYYGDPLINCRQTRHGDVWDAGYRAVYHFAETSGNPVDATSYGTASRVNPQGDPGETHAQNGQSFEMINPPTPPPATFGPTTDSHLQIADGTLPANNPFTIEAWFYLRGGFGQFVGLVTKNRDGCIFPCDQPGEDWVGMEKVDTDKLSLIMDTDGGPGNLDGATTLVANRWYYGAVTSNGVNARRVFLYDTVDAVDTVTAAGYTALSLPTRIGDDSNGNYVDGYLSEVRISTVERSPAWIQTTARNLGCSTASAPNSCVATYPASLRIPFLTVGAAQAVAPAVTGTDCCRIVTTDDGTQLTAQTSALSLVFDRTYAGGLSELRNEEEANRTQSRNGDPTQYNILTTQVNDDTPAANTWHFERDAPGQIEVIEATPTRLKLRQLYDYTSNVHLQRTWTIGSMPRLAVDETLLLDSGENLRGAQGLHPRGATSGAAGICPSQLIPSGFGTYFYCNGQENGTDRFFLVTDDHETYSDMLDVAYTTPFFGPTRGGAGGVYENMWEAGPPDTYFSRVHEATQVATSAGPHRNLFMFYPSIAGLTSAGLEWQPYANDYRTPDVLSFAAGTGWFDAGDLTSSPNDTWNEAEGAYQVDFNPATGLSVDIDGNVIVRRRPLFKVRQWRSLTDPVVTLEGTPLVADRDFTADVKPFVRGYHCTGPTQYAGCTTLANGGLAGANEYLSDASGGKNYTLAFPNGTTWLYLGAESKFRGVNVKLATAGAGTADLQWEYWNGATWANLEGVVGWGDQTNNLKSSGTIFWGDDATETDPAGWATLSINGSPPLYYVRARLASGSYTTPPVEGVVKTDILLFQYCGNVSIAAATFAFAVPAPTAVTLQSFVAVPGDASVTLEWSTGSELSNLGFHVYRGPSAGGPWTRLTSSLIPGLGSSPVGQAYSYHDAGLVNGATYYYRLEDVDAASRSTFHGPVAATPVAEAPPGGGDGGGGGSGSAPSDASCPAWVLSATGPSATPLGDCERHGDPEAVSLDLVSHDERGATIELRTGGFYTRREPSGTVRVFARGAETLADPDGPALPLRRALVDAAVGRETVLASASALDPQAFPGLRPSAVGVLDMSVAADGTVRPARRSRAAPRASAGYLPSFVARLAGTVFQGERKSAVVEMAPVRFSSSRRQLVLARTLRVRLAFTGTVPGETGVGATGRSGSRDRSAFRDVLARLYTRTRGLEAVTFEQLFPSRTRGFSIQTISLQRQGQPVPFRVEPAGGIFGPGSTLFFLADRAATSVDFSSEVAWELVRAKDGRAMTQTSAPPVGPDSSSPAVAVATFETNRIYQPGLLEAPDVWLWDAMLDGIASTEWLDLPGLDATAAPAASATVFLQGGSESGLPDEHHVEVSLNGVPVAEARFEGKKPFTLDFGVPTGALQETANRLEVRNVGDTGVSSLVLLDRVEVRYPQRPAAREGTFEAAWAEAGVVEVSGVAGSAVVVDVTAAPTWLTGVGRSADSVRFHAEAGHRYLVAARASLPTPRAAAVTGSSLRDATNQADYLVIAPRAFLPAAQPLLDRRRGQGLHAQAVAFEEIADAFGYGRPSAEAIHDFLAYAYQSWSRPSPRYVLLLGDATSDPQHFLATSDASPLPARWTRTSYMWTASDPELAAVNGDDAVPDLAIGRLPATTLEQAELLVGKVLEWESSGQGLGGRAVLVADDPDGGGDFEADVADVQSSFLSGRDTEVLKVRELQGATRGAIVAALDDGVSLLSYVGHGGPAVWASENVFNSWDTASLAAQSRQPLLLTLNCLNGYFVAPNFDALPEALLKAEGRGVIAAFSPSGLSLDAPAHEYHRALMAELASGRHARLGDAVLAAQETYARSGLTPELLDVYQLLGDPAMEIR